MFSFRRFSAIFKTRNYEFFRDRSSLAWNLIFPIFLIIGFAFVFSGEGKPEFKWGIVSQQKTLLPQLSELKYTEFVYYNSTEEAIEKVARHQLNVLIDPSQQSFWLNDSSAKGYLSEKVLLHYLPNYQRKPVSGEAIAYVDWVIPGIIGMNLMFSSLFGVGYVIVRYRKSGVLKRIHATPVNALEFLSAQVLSRWMIVIVVSSVIFFSTWALIRFKIQGSLLAFFVVLALGAATMIALGLLIAGRSQSEELTGGLLNLCSWPMMFLSGVWFSLEGASDGIKFIANCLPLTHFVAGARAILVDGASLMEVADHLIVLAVMCFVFLVLGAFSFNWGTQR